MADPEHLKILKQGAKVWNKWRSENEDVQPNLSIANLSDANLSGADLSNADLIGTNLTGTNLSDANLSDANFSYADLIGADFSYAEFIGADFSYADLIGANLSGTNLIGANLKGSTVNGADFTNSIMGYTTLASIDLSEAKGLETVKHHFPSTIGIDSLYKSQGKIPKPFLHGCGVPDDFIPFIPSHFGIRQAIQFYSCFISYSTKDEEFARRLHSRMRDEHLRVWFAPEDIKGGQKLHEQIEYAIQLHDRLLIVLSEDSMQSEWVITEIQKARQTEIEDKRRKLFPITIVNFDKVKSWNRFDADTGRDLAKEVREYYIPDFSNWKDHDAFEKAFERLLRDLKSDDKR
ncbi:MAG TPA: toll/interleukin-1 receptor domain-containing protein [Pyrinomonadaceae bacterium]|nr:toll/interleukin-1 receptor domain-containing protein [Pyrinomonadaceae bacterium]